MDGGGSSGLRTEDLFWKKREAVRDLFLATRAARRLIFFLNGGPGRRRRSGNLNPIAYRNELSRLRRNARAIY